MIEYKTKNISLSIYKEDENLIGTFCVGGRCFPLEESNLENFYKKCLYFMEKNIKVDTFNFWKEINDFKKYFLSLQ